MDVRCIGDHETSSFPCSKAGPYSCGRECGRTLKCDNHICTLECHKVNKALDPQSVSLHHKSTLLKAEPLIN